MTEFQKPNREAVDPNPETRTLVQFSVFGLVMDGDGSILLLNQNAQDPSLPTQRSWRTPGGKVESPNTIDDGSNDILSGAEKPKNQTSNDFVRLIKPEKADEFVATCIPMMDINFLANQCRRELTEEFNKAICRDITSDKALRAELIAAKDPRLVAETDFIIETHTPWIKAVARDPNDNVNLQRMYFMANLSDEARQKVIQLVTNNQALWYNGMQTNIHNMPVSDGSKRSQELSTLKDIFTPVEHES